MKAVSMYQRFIENGVLANLVFVLVLAIGAASYFSMPREQDPTINFNWIEISTILPGASAQDVEKLVTAPLEDAIKNISDTKFVSSVSRESGSRILARFEEIDERTFDKRLADLRREIQSVEQQLPDEVVTPVITEITTSNAFPTAIVAVVGAAEDENLRRQAKWIKTGLENIKGVDSVLATALREPELQVLFDKDQLRELGIPPTALADTVSVYYRDVSAGSIKVGSERWLVRLSGTSVNPDSLASLPIVGIDDEVQLGDVADVLRTRDDATQIVSYNGRPAVMLAVNKKAKSNTLQLVDRINTYIDESNQLADITGVEVVLINDQTEITRNALNVMQNNMLLGLVLVLLVTWLFLGTRLSLITSIGIPFVLTGTFWFISVLGQTLNVPVLLGVVISLGMLVDDAVVIAEGIAFRAQRGLDAIEAAIETVRELFQPVTSAVLTTMVAFLPLMLLPGILGKFMFVVPLVVTTALALSLVEAYWMLPSHTVGLGVAKPDKRFVRPRFAGRLVGGLVDVSKLLCQLFFALLKLPLTTLDWLDKHANPVRQRCLRWIRRSYTRRLVSVMRHPIITVFAVLAIIVLVATLATQAQSIARYLPGSLGEKFAQLEIKADFFANDPIQLFYINVQMPAGTSLEETLEMVTRLEAKALEYLKPGELRQMISYSGLVFTETAPFFGDHFGQVVVALHPKTKQRRTVQEIVESMRASVISTSGPESIHFLTLSGGPPVTKPISIKVRGDDFAEIRQAVEALKAELAAIDGVTDISDDDTSGQRVLSVAINSDALQRARISPAQLSRTLRLLVDGEVVASLRDLGEEIDVRVRAQRSQLNSIDELLQTDIPSAGGGLVSLSTLLDAEYTTGQDSINHYNFRRAIIIEADIDATKANTIAVNNRVKDVWKNELQRQFPSIDLDFSGLLDDIQDSIQAMIVLFGLGMGLIYIILGTQFKSYFQPLLILCTVPMAFAGVLTGLLFNGNPLSLYTLYGVVALAGISVNSAIVLIATANGHLARGMRVQYATLFAARRRVVPILITSLSTIAGLFSLATGLGGHSLIWGPIATSIVWGLFFSTLLTLFLIPLLYSLFMRLKFGAADLKPPPA